MYHCHYSSSSPFKHTMLYVLYCIVLYWSHVSPCTTLTIHDFHCHCHCHCQAHPSNSRSHGLNNRRFESNLSKITRPVAAIKSVREITNSSNTFSATNITRNIVWFLPLRDNFVCNFIFGTKFSSLYLTKGEKRLGFRLSFVNLQRAKDGTHVFDAKYRYVFVV